MLTSFPPVIGPNSRILIIGSMPGEASLRVQEYYAYPHNQFWRIIFEVFEQGRPPHDYTDKKNTILRHGLGLWDSLAACERTGSLDGNITCPQANDFPALLAQYPQIHTLLFNGQAAFKFYKQALGLPSKTYHIMPSTSPAHAALTYTQKLQVWQAALLETL